MSGDDAEHEIPTRRDYVKYGGAVLGGGLLAGCTGDSGSDSPGTENSTEDTSTDEADSETTYSATMEPMGTVEFDEPPEEVIPALLFGVDTMVALGQMDRVTMMDWKGTLVESVLNMAPGVSIDPDSIDDLGTAGKDKESFYEASPDLFMTDPNHEIAFVDGLDAADMDEIQQNVAPFLGNFSRETRAEDWYQWPDSEEYGYLGMYDQLEQYAQLFGVEDRAAALRELHDELIASIKAELPPEEERPSVALPHTLAPMDGDIWAYAARPGNQDVYGTKQFRDLEVTDALEDEHGPGGRSSGDAEMMLDADPDVIILYFGIDFYNDDASDFHDDAEGKSVVEFTLENYRNDPILSELTAVQNDRVYVGPTGQQGPLTNLYQTEMLAKQLYPDIYGEFPGVDDDGTWDIPEGEQLFDRQQLADIINGDI